MFTAALFLIAKKLGEKPKCQSMGRQIKELGYIHTVKYHSATKRNEPLIHTTWINLTIIMLSEKNQTKKRT